MAHILIADNDESIAERLQDVLFTAGHVCGWVSSGEKALDVLRWRRPDLLLLDHDMPGLSGAQVLRSLRCSAEHYDLPVIMFTGTTSDVEEPPAYVNGAQAYVRKPFDIDILAAEIMRHLQCGVARPPQRSLAEHLEQAAARWRDAPTPRLVA